MTVKLYSAAVAAMLMLVACDKPAQDPVYTTPSEKPVQVEPSPTDDSSTATESEDNSDAAAVASENEVAKPVLDWTESYSPDVPYYNSSEAAVALHIAADAASEVIGQIEIGDGGYIKNCNEEASWCEISVEGLGKTGWVEMSAFEGSAG